MLSILLDQLVRESKVEADAITIDRDEAELPYEIDVTEGRDFHVDVSDVRLFELPSPSLTEGD